jgi:hypothetical protein
MLRWSTSQHENHNDERQMFSMMHLQDREVFNKVIPHFKIDYFLLMDEKEKIQHLIEYA